MRLLKRGLKPVHVFKSETVDSGYVGTESVDLYSHTVMCRVSPGENKVTSEIYGERANNMLNIICGKNAAIDYKLSFTCKEQPEYKVVSKKEYTDHTVILAEVIV